MIALLIKDSEVTQPLSFPAPVAQADPIHEHGAESIPMNQTNPACEVLGYKGLTANIATLPVRYSVHYQE